MPTPESVAYHPITIVLVACCGKKLQGRHQAQDLYQSDLFKKARAWAEANSNQWFILSAKYGLVPPDTEIDAYDLTLNTAGSAYRAEWASRVAEQLLVIPEGRIVVLAGNRYCQGWPEHFSHIERPMEGLPIGKQLAWLKRALTPRQD